MLLRPGRHPYFSIYTTGNVNAVTFHTQHHVLIPSGTQTLNRQVYRINPNPNAVVTAGGGIAVASTALQQPDETAKYLYG